MAEWKLLGDLSKKADALFLNQAERTAEIATKLHKMQAMLYNNLSKRLRVKEGASIVMNVGSVLWNVGSLSYSAASTTFTLARGVTAGFGAASTGGKFLLNGGLPLFGAASTASRGLSLSLSLSLSLYLSLSLSLSLSIHHAHIFLIQAWLCWVEL